MNQFSKISEQESKPTEEELKSYTVVVYGFEKATDLAEMDERCRALGIPLLSEKTFGGYSATFTDLGENFKFSVRH